MTTNDYRGLFDLKGRVAVVTGGAGLLGRHFCCALATYGASVAVVDIDGAAAGALARDVRNEFGVPAAEVACDVSKPDQVRAMADRVERELGPIDILLNNAATRGRDMAAFLAPVEQVSLDMWRAITAVNLDGVFLVAQEIGRRMAERGHGSIVQTSSIYGVVAPDQRIYEGTTYEGHPVTSPAVYTATKAAIIGLTRHFATHWGGRGVRVNALAPGGVWSGDDSAYRQRYNEDFKRRYEARVPLGRMGRADEIVGTVLFLASDASSYVTGQVIAVDGGLSAW